VRRRSIIVATVVLAHLLFLWWATIEPPRAAASHPEPLAVVVVRPIIVVSREVQRVRRPVRVPANAVIDPTIEIPDLERPIAVVAGVGTMAPQPIGAAPDVEPFAQQAGLAPGTGATVVLRLEVLGSGELGRVAVEVSGGSARIDQAAESYARAMLWTGGMKEGRPEPIWIRWAVRLQS
jgi:hypothetical protein